MVMPGDNIDVTVELIVPVAIKEGLRFAIREGGRTVGSGNDRTSFSLGADAAWEIDLFGRIRRGIEAAGTDAESVWYDREALRVAITAELAKWNRSAVPFNLIYSPGRAEPVVLPELLTAGTVLEALARTAR